MNAWVCHNETREFQNESNIIGYNQIPYQTYETLPVVCNNVTKTRTTYPYLIEEEGRSIGDSVDINRIILSELKEENQAKQTEIDLLKAELCKLNPGNKVFCPVGVGL